MLVFINPELMTINGETENRKNGGSPYFKVSCDGSSLITPKDPSKPNNPRPIMRMACNATVTNEGVGEGDRRIMEYIDLPTTFSSRDNGKGVSILVRELENENERDVYVIAFPFHGVLKPLPKSEYYDVLKGMITVSGSYSIPFNNYTYKNILYLVVSPTQEHANDLIGITLESYCLKSNKKKGVSVTMHEVMNVTINKEKSWYELWDQETDPVDMTQYKDIPVWELAPVTPTETRKPRPRHDRLFPTKEGSGNRNERPSNGQRNSYKKTENFKGNNSAPKSAPNHSNPVTVKEPLSTNLDTMIENAMNGDRYPSKKRKKRR